MRAIVIAAGEATRWKNYLNVPKHYLQIDGEPIIERTVRLLRENGVGDIHVVSKEYCVPHCYNFRPKLNYEQNADADKFLSSKELWNRNGRTVVFYGDVFFTEESMNTIVGFENDEWTLFCRPDRSRITGRRWGECFAQSFYATEISRHEKALHRIVRLYKKGVIKRCGGWEHYRAMVGRPDDEIRSPHIMTTNYFTIDDFTEDFDFPTDYDSFIEKFRRHQSRRTTGIENLSQRLLASFLSPFRRKAS
jgi:MobA-like NTP transferase domain